MKIRLRIFKAHVTVFICYFFGTVKAKTFISVKIKGGLTF